MTTRMRGYRQGSAQDNRRMAMTVWRAPLVGRSVEMAELEEQRRRAASGEFRCVLVLADPGLGKSRLASEFLARNRTRTIRLTARAYPLSQTASFGLWAEALERHLRGLEHEQVSALCEGFLDDLAALVRSVAVARGGAPDREPPKLRLLDGIAAVLGKLASQHPVVLFLDDMHSADPSSWEALGYLARNLSDSRVLVIAAARSTELAGQQAATEIVVGLEQEGVLDRLCLSPLDQEKIGELAGVVLGEEPPDSLVDWLTERSRGNPLFALSQLQALIEEGANLAVPELGSLPQGLAERILLRLGQLDESARATLDVLAAVGGRVEVADLLQLTGRPMERLSVVLDALVRARLVMEEQREGRITYEIAHPLIQEAIYQAMGGASRRALHRVIGRSLLAAGRLGAAAPHFALSAEAGDPEAIDALRDAVRQAEEREAYREALTILSALVDLLPPGDRRWIEVLDAMRWQAEWVVDHRADVHALMGIKAMRQIDSVLEGFGDPASRATVKFRLASFLAWGTGELEEAEQICIRAGELFEEAGDQPRALIAANELAWIRGLRGDLESMAAGARQVAEAAEIAGERFALIQALAVIGMSAGWRGRFDEADAAWERSKKLAVEDAKPYRLTLSCLSLAVAFAFGGRIHEALPLVEQAKTLNQGWRDSPLPEWESIINWVAGRFPAALENARQALRWSAGALSKRRALGMSYAALAAVETDQLDEARVFLSKARAAYSNRDWAFYRDYLLYAEAVLAWRQGELARAVEGLQRVGARLRAMGALSALAFVLVDLAQIATETGDVEVAREAGDHLADVADEIDRELYRALAAIGACWSNLAAGASDLAAGQAREALTHLSGAGYPFFLARAQEGLGRSLSATDNAAALEALKASAAGFEACGALWRRAQVIEAMRGLGGAGRRAAAAALGPGSLTRREREVARLAARGHSAREIAERLVIAERTVESHLANVYAKLGVDSKLDLVRRAPELRL